MVPAESIQHNSFFYPIGFARRLVGGLIGSRIPREGGQSEQFYMAGIMGIIFSLPFACMILWFFTGW